jgi:hypothetical protein
MCHKAIWLRSTTLYSEMAGKFYMYLSTADSSFTTTTISSLGVKECDYKSKGHGFALGFFFFLTCMSLFLLVLLFYLLSFILF